MALAAGGSKGTVEQAVGRENWSQVEGWLHLGTLASLALDRDPELELQPGVGQGTVAVGCGRWACP